MAKFKTKPIRWLDCGILVEFFRNFDQNSDGKDCKYVPFLNTQHLQNSFSFIQWIFKAEMLHYFFCEIDQGNLVVQFYTLHGTNVVHTTKRKTQCFSYKIIHFRAAHLHSEAIYIFQPTKKNWVPGNLMGKKILKSSQKLCMGRKFRWGVFKGARGGGFGVGRFKRGADLEHNRISVLKLK